MKRRRVLGALGGLAVAGGCLGRLGAPPASGSSGSATPTYERGTVTLHDDSGETLARVSVRIADTQQKRYLGLSATESLGPDEGMLFVHDREGEHAYVMREMDFPLDIVFADANGTITAVHHAPRPPEGTSGSDLTRYRGRGKYVLEVTKGYTTRHDVAVGDTMRVPPGV
jgi:hypothetical protein